MDKQEYRVIAHRFYNSGPWKKLRKQYISQIGGFCERCRNRGILEPVYIVHHKIELNAENINDPYIALNSDNLEGLCLKCHNKETFEKYGVTSEEVKFDEAGNVVSRKAQKLDAPLF